MENHIKENNPASLIVKSYIGIAGIVIALLMLFGVLMRMTQASYINISPVYFYQLLTAHGIGMVAIAGLGGAAVMWHFLGQYVKLNAWIAYANLFLFLLGVILVLSSIFFGGFAAAWTFLYPLPSHSMGLWTQNAAAIYMLGVLVVGVGFLLFYLETARAIIHKYSSFYVSLGWKFLQSGQNGEAPPPTLIASTVVTIINIVSILVGAVILAMMIVNVYFPVFYINPLLAKNMIYFFGHVFINSTIYMAVITVYEIIPRYTKKPWKSYKPFIWSWSATCLMVLAVYPHHLLMDYAQPAWLHVIGEIVSYTSSIPVLAVTLTGTLGAVYKSQIKWDLTSSLLLLSIFGWSAGVIPAVIDGTIAVNMVMHNTLWVPGHFHLYLLVGCVSMLLAFLSWISNNQDISKFSRFDKVTLTAFVLSSLGFVFMFLASGRASIPRRWAAHFSEWIIYSQIASLFAIAVFLSVTSFIFVLIKRMVSKKRLSR